MPVSKKFLPHFSGCRVPLQETLEALEKMKPMSIVKLREMEELEERRQQFEKAKIVKQTDKWDEIIDHFLFRRDGRRILRWMFIVVFIFSLLFLATTMLNLVLRHNFEDMSTLQEIEIPIKSKLKEERNENDETICQHTKQGALMVTDSNGFVCLRRDVNSTSKCCKHSTDNLTWQTSCERCNLSVSCCRVYEHCVSCCLNPKHRDLISSRYT